MKKAKLGKIFNGVWKTFGNKGMSDTEGKCIIASGGWTPVVERILVMCRVVVLMTVVIVDYASVVFVQRR